MFNNIKRKQLDYEKNISIISTISIFISVVSVVIKTFLFMTRIFNVDVLIFILAFIIILLLPYIGVKIDLIRGYE